MPLFSKNQERAVQSLLLKLVNNNCPELTALAEGPRIEGRVNLTIVVQIIPLKDGRPQFDQAFAAVTKEFSTSGMGIVLSGPHPLDELFVGFRLESDMKYVRAKAKHLNPMGAGFFQLGIQLSEVIVPGDYPGLDTISC